MYGWPQSWKLQLLSYAEDKHGINDLLLRYMYDITISVKTLPLLEEHQLVFYITYKLLKSNPKKPKDKHGSLYYLNPSLNSSGVEIYKTVLFFRLLCKAPSAIFRLHTVLTKNLFFILQSMVRGNLLATVITFQFCFYCHFLHSKNNFYSVHFPPNSTLISLILCYPEGAHTWKRDDRIPWRVNYILVNNLNCHQSIIFLASFFESRYFLSFVYTFNKNLVEISRNSKNYSYIFTWVLHKQCR